MAGGPYKDKNASIYYIKWHNAREYPDDPQCTESLKTGKLSVAKSRKNKLEALFNEGKHDPWIISWHENDAIKPLIYGSLLDSKVSIKEIKPPSKNSIPTLHHAKLLFYKYKTASDPAKVQRHEWNGNTERNNKAAFNSFEEFVGPNVPIDKISDKKLKQFVHQDSINSDHTVANYTRIVNTFFNWCIDQDWIGEKDKPVYNAPTPQADIPVFIYNDELYQICQHKMNYVIKYLENGQTQPDNSQLYMPLGWILIRYTGMRPIELKKLHMNAIDLSARQITIGKRIGHNTNRTKTSLQRRIAMDDIVYDICKLLMDEDIRAKDRYMKNSTHLFGRPTRRFKYSLSLEFTKARRGVLPARDEVTLYVLRDTRAVELLTRPIDKSNGAQNPMHLMYNIRDELGHKNLETTQKYWKAVPPLVQNQRLHNPKILYKIINTFHKTSIQFG